MTSDLSFPSILSFSPIYSPSHSRPSISLAVSSHAACVSFFFLLVLAFSVFGLPRPSSAFCDNKFWTSVGRTLTFCGVVQRILPSTAAVQSIHLSPLYPSASLPACLYPSVCWGFIWHLTCVRETAPQIDLVENVLCPVLECFLHTRFKMQLNICWKKERNEK